MVESILDCLQCLFSTKKMEVGQRNKDLLDRRDSEEEKETDRKRCVKCRQEKTEVKSKAAAKQPPEKRAERQGATCPRLPLYFRENREVALFS